tara:strand:+ start:3123 stop:4622 length:1500 start_codon:yes stop_codon:yes gene_type:complete
MNRKSRYGKTLRQCICGALAILVAGCSDKDPQPVGVVGHLKSYFGGVAADEARAALVGRDTLSAGGTSADAAVSMAFALMVSRPDAAGPGGGGVCVHYDSASNKAETLEFFPKLPIAVPPKGRWPALVPGSFRGLFALHARFGNLRWEQLVQPAEQAARFGWPIAKGLSTALSVYGTKALKDDRTRGVFSGKSGKFIAPGETIEQVGLAGTLGIIRGLGPGVFYSGRLARRYIDGIKAAGGWLTIEELRSYRPVWKKTVQVQTGNHVLHFPVTKGLGSGQTVGIWGQIGNKRGFSSSNEPSKAALLVAAARNVSSAAGAEWAGSGGSAGLFAMDFKGNATSCVVTMNRPFGSGVTAGETGVIQAAPAVVGSGLNVAPVVMANHNISQAFLAATAAGDRYSGVALASTLMRLIDGNTQAEEALAQPRYAPGVGASDVLIEERLEQGARSIIVQKGLVPYLRKSIGQVNLMYCKGGIVNNPSNCVVRTDPRTPAYGINSEL